MSRNGKVIVAMSGGVDSSVAACLLKEQGYECIGVFLRVGAEQAETSACSIEPGRPPRRLRHGCCSATDAIDARAIASRLGIPFYALNFREGFEGIIEYFVDEYSQGRTPNPCVMCNIQLKFGRLLQYADAMDAPFVATGHYARIVQRNGAPCLARGANAAKDQSYVLFGIRRDDLGRCLFPIGGIPDKAEVRAAAAELGLRVHDKPDSQEICFVPNNDYKELVRQRRPETICAGEIRDVEGRALARHEGVANFTVGQRRGLGFATGSPLYVTRLDVLSNTVTVGPKEALLASGLAAQRVNWLVDPPSIGTSCKAQIKIRHMHSAAPGWIERRADERITAMFDEPQSAVTPGQAAVFYEDEIVLGGGWIRGAVDGAPLGP